MPKVSIIMNCLNGEKYLREAIDSIYAQTYKDWEIIFWDNASTDSSAEIAKSYDSRLKYFRGDKTVPLGAARNLALKQASGEYIAFLDTDDIWFPEKLQKQIPLFNNSAVGIVFSNAIVYNLVLHKRNYYFRPDSIAPKGVEFTYFFRNYSKVICMQTVMIRSSVLKQTNEWFDENFQICTDFDLFLRILSRWSYDFVNEPLAEYRVHNNSTMNKMYNRLPMELEAAINKFRKVIPEFESKNSSTITMYAQMITCMWGKYYWLTGDGAKARTFYGRYLYSSIKVFVLYFLTFLPFRAIYSVRNSYKKIF